MVSPAYQEGFPLVIAGSGVMGLAADGEHVLVETLGSFAELEGVGALEATYEIRREAAGWESIPLEAPLSKFPRHDVMSVSPDFSGSLWSSNIPGQLIPELYFTPAGGSLTLMGPSAPPDAQSPALNFTGASNDLLHAVFTAASPQGEEEHRIWPGDPTLDGRRPSLYEYVGTGNIEPELVGVSDEHRVAHISESHLISDCGTVLGQEHDTYNAISEGGSTVFFTSFECGGAPAVNELYARIGQEKTVAISEPQYPSAQGGGPGPEECDSACSTATHEPATFAGASANGSKVFFLTAQPLLNSDRDTATDLYEAEIEGEASDARVSKLIQVSGANTGQAAEVQGVARVSEDGSHVYFIARGALASEPDLSLPSGHQAATEGEENLYVYERDARYPGGHISFVATLSPQDAQDWRETDRRPVQATPDGRFLVFQSVAPLTSDEEGQEEAGQVFEYDAQKETLVRVSQGQHGYNNDGNSAAHAATIPVQGYVTDSPLSRFLGLAVSADGSDVFFSSEDALTRQASNGVNSVYEYHEGQVSLISDGHDATRLAESPATELIGTDESGLDVFFTTADPLVPEDTNTQVDLYDARIDGGFAPITVPAPCLGDSCQEPSTAPPSLLAPGVSSSVAEPPTSSVGAEPPAKKTTKHKARAKKRKSRAKRGRKTAVRAK